MNPLKRWLGQEWQHLTTITPSDRPWEMPLAAALSSGLPLLIAAWADHLAFGLAASLGGLAFLYLPRTPLAERMVQIMACSFALTACYTLGLLSQLVPAATIPALTLIAILATMLTRFYDVGPPGSLFFVMVAAIGAYTPTDASQMPSLVGLLSMGALLACLIAFLYSLHILRRREPVPNPQQSELGFDFLVLDSVIIGASVGLSLVLAQVLGTEKAYWVPVACLAVIQGTTLRAAWNRQVHRILGTTLGLLLAWGILALPLNGWSIAALIMALMFLIESSIVLHYALAAVFITPLGILLAEAATLDQASVSALVTARFLDTVLGACVGFLGALCLHSPRFRAAVGRPLRWLLGAKESL